MRGNILIVEDEQEIAELISLYLEKEGITTWHAPDGETGLNILRDEKIDLVILDINLPGIDGFEVLQSLRRDSHIPVIIVSARTDDADAILGFGIGADDFVSKPFSPRVLTARVRSHLRRNYQFSPRDNNKVIFGDFELDTDSYTLKKAGEIISLSPKEMEILIYLAENEGKPKSQNEIFEKVWGATYGDLSTVSVHIRRIRKKIEEDSQKPKYIQTAYGFGYLFKRGDK